MIARRYLIKGHVQGALLRESTVRQARELGVTGWVRRRHEGRVEVYAVGKTAQFDQLAARVDRLLAEDALIERNLCFMRRSTL